MPPKAINPIVQSVLEQLALAEREIASGRWVMFQKIVSELPVSQLHYDMDGAETVRTRISSLLQASRASREHLRNAVNRVSVSQKFELLS